MHPRADVPATIGPHPRLGLVAPIDGDVDNRQTLMRVSLIEGPFEFGRAIAAEDAFHPANGIRQGDIVNLDT